MVDIARRRSAKVPNAEFAVGSAEDLPFPDDRFTVAWSAHSFHHWADRNAGLVECQRVLAPGGRLLILETRTTGEHGLSLDGALDLGGELGELGFVDPSLERHGNEYVIEVTVPR